MKIKRCVLAMAVVAGLMAVGAGTASAVPASGSAAPAGINVLEVVFKFFGSSWPVDDPCPMCMD